MITLNKQLLNKTAKTAAITKFKTLRLAFPVRGICSYHGGTKAKAAAMNATLTRVNGIFNKDLAVKLILIANNDLIIYLMPQLTLIQIQLAQVALESGVAG
jgi:hypothetical protein